MFAAEFQADEFGALKRKCASQCLSVLAKPGDA